MAHRRAVFGSQRDSHGYREMLRGIAANLWWCWHPRGRELFEWCDGERFHASGHNAWAVVRRLKARRWAELEADPDFLRHLRAAYRDFQSYLAGPTWCAGRHRRPGGGVIAYFCMEYGLHESLPLYAGGLGILAGDHLKSASDLGLPLVGVGILWHRGYTRQRIGPDGRQIDLFPRLALADLPLSEVMVSPGRPLRVSLTLAGETVHVRAWRLNVGRVPLFLLDTMLPENRPRHRRITDVLYSGDRDMRIRQEIVLGIGGWRMLRALGIPVTVCHLNEGHAAFLSLERLAERMAAGRTTWARALEAVRRTTVFTTHTPVPAGNEEFAPALVDRYLGDYAGKTGLSRQQFHDLARVRRGDASENFGMTPLALRTAAYANGVAALHGRVARRMWKALYPGRSPARVPIGHVTNGIHLATWLHPRMAELLDEVLGEGWMENQDRPALWKGVDRIEDTRLWQLHQDMKLELISFCRRRLRRQLDRLPQRGPRSGRIEEILDPGALTIGFARRFATYKRATLIFSDPDRLARILNDPRRPVQLIFAGKAHPADTAGKALVQAVYAFSRQPRFRRRVVFLEDYDMDVARHMVAGVDVWLNNPQRPREASGTSGMKPALHGGLNLSILDGWWPEGFNGINGWAIGRAVDHDDTPAADRRDAASLYRLLEREIVPTYYRRDRIGLPAAWIARMKNALRTIPAFFNSHRQVKQYLARYYLPAMRHARRIRPGGKSD